jgi:hypothetical protein
MLRNVGKKSKCLDKMNQRLGGRAGVYTCHGQGSNQVCWLLVGERSPLSCTEMDVHHQQADPLD